LKIGWVKVSLPFPYNEDKINVDGGITGSIGNLGSAATVAASSFTMTLTDPHPLLNAINLDRWNALRGSSTSLTALSSKSGLTYVEPSGSSLSHSREPKERPIESVQLTQASQNSSSSGDNVLKGKIQRLGDFIDTDAVSL
jgi:hypothetical protein